MKIEFDLYEIDQGVFEVSAMRQIVKRQIIGPDAPELGTIEVVDNSSLTIPLARPSTGPTALELYELDRRLADEGPEAFVNIASGINIFGAGNEYPDTGLAADTGYTYRLRAKDTTGRYSPYVFKAGTTSSVPLPPPAPDTPINFIGDRTSATNINLSWSRGPTGSAPDDYDLDYSTSSSSGPWTSLGFVGTGTSTSQTVTNVQYWYRIKADTGAESSAYATTTVLPEASGSRNVYYDATWSSSGVTSNGSLTDGGRYSSKYEPEGGVNTYSTADENLPKTSSTLDQRVANSVSYNGETITARTPGGYFLQQTLYYDKEYECINGSSSGANDAQDKPRTFFDLTNDAYECDFDREVWVGFSFFVHPDHTHDVATRAHQGRVNIFNVGATDNFSQFRIQTGGRPNGAQPGYVGGFGGSTEHYLLGFQTNSTAVADMGQAYGGKTTWVDIGDMVDDVGLWTDFVIRYRLNPFTSTTNPGSAGIPNAKNHSYAGNKGIMQVWKGTGPYLNANQDRAMTKVFNLFNAPVGGVPHATLRLEYRMGLYKYGWKNNATSNTGWIYYGLDEFRYGHRKALESGEVHSQNGSKDVDVTPSGLPLTGWVEQS